MSCEHTKWIGSRVDEQDHASKEEMLNGLTGPSHQSNSPIVGKRTSKEHGT